VLHAARWKCKTQKIAKKSSSDRRTIVQLCRAISSQLRHISTTGKNLLSSNISSGCSHNTVNFGLLAAEIGPVVWDTPANFNGFRVLAALLSSSGCQPNFAALHIGRRAPPMFGRATITLGIGPHSSLL